jgi:F-type H+-transporting ATPase subunit b
VLHAQEHPAVETTTEHATHSPADAHADGAVHGAGEHEQAPLIPSPTDRVTQLQALWVLIIFILLLVILYPTAWRGVLAGLKAREERIRKDIADAEAARKRAETTLREYNTKLAAAENEVREMISKATTDAERAAAVVRTRAQQDAEEAKERAIKDIDAAAKQAMAEVYEQTASLATSVAEKILRRNLNADDQRDLVNQSLEQMQTLKG